MEMKQSFDSLESFRESMDTLTQLNCGTPAGTYSAEQASAFLARLSDSWNMGADDVTAIVTQEAWAQVAKRQRALVWEALDRLKIHIAREDFERRWEELTDAEKIRITNDIVTICERGGVA